MNLSIQEKVNNGSFKKSLLKAVHKKMPVLCRSSIRSWWLESNESLDGLSYVVDDMSGMLGYEFEPHENYSYATIKIAPTNTKEELMDVIYNPKNAIISSLDEGFDSFLNTNYFQGVYTVDLPYSENELFFSELQKIIESTFLLSGIYPSVSQENHFSPFEIYKKLDYPLDNPEDVSFVVKQMIEGELGNQINMGWCRPGKSWVHMQKKEIQDLNDSGFVPFGCDCKKYNFYYTRGDVKEFGTAFYLINKKKKEKHLWVSIDPM